MAKQNSGELTMLGNQPIEIKPNEGSDAKPMMKKNFDSNFKTLKCKYFENGFVKRSL